MGARGPRPSCTCADQIGCRICRRREQQRRYEQALPKLALLPRRRVRESRLRLPEDPVALAYLAGLFDGEGCVTQYASNENWVVQIGMTDRGVIEYLAGLGGSMRVETTKPGRAAVASEAAIAMQGRPLLTGPLALEAVFTFPRPKSHYGTGRNIDRLKPTAKRYVDVAPDLDKLLRACGDAMAGIVYRQDAQIVQITARKVYGEPANARLFIREQQTVLLDTLQEGAAA